MPYGYELAFDVDQAHSYGVFSNIKYEADRVRDQDKVMIQGLLGNFYGQKLNTGIGFKRAHGSILSGDYFELFRLPDENYMFIFGDISGHGLLAYTTLIRLRSAITLSLIELENNQKSSGKIDTKGLVNEIGNKFLNIMERSNSIDFASVLFTFITNDNDKYHLRFFNHGMHFPLVVRKCKDNLLDVYDLNKSKKGWQPANGHLWSSEIRSLINGEFEDNPYCDFTLYEGDRILYFSDGIIDAHKKDDQKCIFGIDRLRNFLTDYLDAMPQEVINMLYNDVFQFIDDPSNQEDDMTAVLIDLPLISS